jgi:tetratricopeptide (TPR) repeat protein
MGAKMKRRLFAAIALACLSCALSSCGGKSFSQLMSIEERTKDKNNPANAFEIQAAILEYQKVVDQKVHASDRIAYYYKLLGMDYMERKMYGEAYKAFVSGIEISPQNPNLFYNAGLCAGYMSKAEIGLADGSEEKRLDCLSKAEKAYKRALEIDPQHDKTMYALAVLYVFELNRPADAVPYLATYMERNKNDFNSRFVMARVYYLQKRYDEAVGMYDEIMRLTGPDNLKQEAKNNRDAVLLEAETAK